MAVVSYTNRPALNKLITCSHINCLLDANETENLNEKWISEFYYEFKLSASLN